MDSETAIALLRKATKGDAWSDYERTILRFAEVELKTGNELNANGYLEELRTLLQHKLDRVEKLMRRILEEI